MLNLLGTEGIGLALATIALDDTIVPGLSVTNPRRAAAFRPSFWHRALLGLGEVVPNLI
ncbi:hypothetical protein COMA2_10204 [Candidatus Nitrospira nitrificans]|uniref:Uncharacterized protein n=1 Tax=Candidatus Nitrospira nitrificans TaxID=1742973 RepID=A0A0S4L748_9BACT|nr:hypothetical protein COMA2_10204 [Candidatus Nitrospira nitrificans]